MLEPFTCGLSRGAQAATALCDTTKGIPRFLVQNLAGVYLGAGGVWERQGEGKHVLERVQAGMRLWQLSRETKPIRLAVVSRMDAVVHFEGESSHSSRKTLESITCLSTTP